jgi:hypothetical protein
LKAAFARAGVGPWLRERAELPASIHDAFNDGEKVEAVYSHLNAGQSPIANPRT